MKPAPSRLALRAMLVAALVAPVSVYAADPATQPAAAAVPMRYHLSVGQELVYRSSDTTRSTKQPNQPAYSSTATMTFRVIGTNSDGSWQIVESSHEGADGQTGGGGEPPHIAKFDLSSDGHAKVDPDDVMEVRPSVAFPQLPPDAATTSWQGHGLIDDEITSFIAAPTTEPSARNIDAQSTSLFTRIYNWTDTSRLRFDTDRGLMVHSDQHTEEPLYNRAGDATLDLMSDLARPADWVSQYSNQVNALLTARKQYDKIMDAAETVGDSSAATTDPALAILTAAKPNVTLPDLSAVLDAAIASHAAYVGEIKQEAEDNAAIVGKPAPAWDLTDLKGNHHSLAALHGKVVVLDFWYRGCGWCMRAMPQMLQLAQDYRDKPVGIFGMNVDREDKDARFVSDFFKLPYPTLRTTMTQYVPPGAGPATAPSQPQPPAAAYRVQGYPTLFIIGPDGILRVRHVGYSPTLHDDVARQIDTLLASAGKAP